MDKPATLGLHHLGLTVATLEKTANFFTEILGWNEIRRDENYPAIFVSDGSIMLTLWQAQTDHPRSFDKNAQIGLHHLALQVASKQQLEAIYQRLLESGTQIELAPEQLRDGPMKHMMCYEPSGIRVEFIWPGQ